MISIEQISGEISALEEEKPTYVIMQKLADLYIVRDHIILSQHEPISEVISISGDSEFIQSINGKSTNSVLEIIDELMDAIRVLNLPLYNNVMRKFQ